MGFNSAFKGLSVDCYFPTVNLASFS
jgi:hypothetical protein